MHFVHAIHVGNREVHVKTTASLVGPRLAHKGCVLSGASDNLFDCGLEHEGSIGCIECFAVPKINLILRRAELVVARKYSDVELVEHAQQVQEGSVRVNQCARGVDATGASERTLVDTVFSYIRDIKLKLWPADRLQTKCVVFGDNFAKHHSR